MTSRATARRRRAPLALLGALALTLSALSAPAVAEPDLPADGQGLSETQLEAQAEAVSGIPGENEISRSRNMVLVSHLDKQAPLDATQTDIAFQGNYAFVGNYNGFVIYDIRNPKKPAIKSQVLCPGSQNDVSVYGNLLFLSTDSSRSDNSCNSTSQSATEQGVVGGHQGLRHQRQGSPEVRRGRRDRLRFAHPHAGAGQEQEGRVPVHLLLLAQRHVPGLPAAARQDLDRQGSAEGPGSGVPAQGAGALPGRRQRRQARQHRDRLRHGDLRLPRHHRLPAARPRGRRLHG